MTHTAGVVILHSPLIHRLVGIKQERLGFNPVELSSIHLYESCQSQMCYCYKSHLNLPNNCYCTTQEPPSQTFTGLATQLSPILTFTGLSIHTPPSLTFTVLPTGSTTAEVSTKRLFDTMPTGVPMLPRFTLETRSSETIPSRFPILPRDWKTLLLEFTMPRRAMA